MNGRVLILGILVLWVVPQDASALKEFKKAFEQRYVQPLDKAAQRVFRRTNCNVCHVKGEKKSVHNAYGDQIAARIAGNAKQRLKEAKEVGNRDQQLEQIMQELAIALEQTESLPAPDGGTFGERLKSGQLPVTPAVDPDDAQTDETVATDADGAADPSPLKNEAAP